MLEKQVRLSDSVAQILFQEVVISKLNSSDDIYLQLLFPSF